MAVVLALACLLDDPVSLVDQGAPKPERAQLLFFAHLGSLFAPLAAPKRLVKVAAWPEGSYYGLMLATFTAIPGLPIGTVHFVRYESQRRLSAACAFTSCAALLISFWLFSRR